MAKHTTNHTILHTIKDCEREKTKKPNGNTMIPWRQSLILFVNAFMRHIQLSIAYIFLSFELKHLQLSVSLLNWGKKYVTFDVRNLHKFNYTPNFRTKWKRIQTNMVRTNLHKPSQTKTKQIKHSKHTYIFELKIYTIHYCLFVKSPFHLKIYIMNLHI